MMEVGIGHHGEPGARVEQLKTADQVADDMLQIVLDDHGLREGTEVAVLVSGLGATPVNELYVLYDRIEVGLEAKGLKVHRAFVGNYFTSLEMIGATLTVMALDDELKTLLDVECASPAMSVSGGRPPPRPLALSKARASARLPPLPQGGRSTCAPPPRPAPPPPSSPLLNLGHRRGTGRCRGRE